MKASLSEMLLATGGSGVPQPGAIFQLQGRERRTPFRGALIYQGSFEEYHITPAHWWILDEKSDIAWHWWILDEKSDIAWGRYFSTPDGRGGHPLTVCQNTKDHLCSIIPRPIRCQGYNTLQMILGILGHHTRVSSSPAPVAGI